MIARDDDSRGRADAFERFLRQGAVADDVAQADDRVRAARSDVGQDAVEGVPVGMKIGENRVFHCP